jgi:hypothetical protein
LSRSRRKTSPNCHPTYLREFLTGWSSTAAITIPLQIANGRIEPIRRVCFSLAEPKTLTLRPVEGQALTCSPVRQACDCSLDVQRMPQPLMGERLRGTDTRKQSSVAGYLRRSNAGAILRQARSKPSFLTSFSHLSLRSASFLSRSLRPRSRAS